MGDGTGAGTGAGAGAGASAGVDAETGAGTAAAACAGGLIPIRVSAKIIKNVNEKAIRKFTNARTITTVNSRIIAIPGNFLQLQKNTTSRITTQKGGDEQLEGFLQPMIKNK